MKVRNLLTMVTVGLALFSAVSFAQKAQPKVELDNGLQSLEAGQPVPLANRPLARRAVVPDQGVPAPVAEYTEPIEFGVIITFDGSRAALEAAGIRVVSQVGHIFTAQMRRDEIGRLRFVSGIQSARLSRYTHPHLDVSIPDVKADLVHNGTPPTYAGHVGAGMLIGDVDSGIDWTRSDFKDGAGKSRILYIWDQTDATGPSPGGSYTYGTQWIKSDIDNTPGTVRETDTDGHGTNVAGVLIGNGANTSCGKPQYRFVGMAPQANFIEVKTDYTDAHIIDGVSYIFQQAAALGKDCVVNLSLGSTADPHDGSDAFGQAISGMVGNGKYVVASAGNDGGSKTHGKLTTTTTTPNTDKFTFTIPTYTRNSSTFNDYVLISGWYDPSVSASLRIKGPNAADTLSCGFGKDVAKALTASGGFGGKLWVDNQSALYGYTGTATHRQFEIEIYDSVSSSAPRNGTWEIDFNTNSGSPTGMRADIWIYGIQLGASGAAPVMVTGLDNTTLVGSPASADNVFAVAAHSTKNTWTICSGSTCSYTSPPTIGAIASFSSVGPRSDGVLKPEISAPGFGVATTHTSSVAFSSCFPDSQHEVTQGTSFSAPHVAGAVALWLECNPHASVSAMKGAFESHTRTDSYTGSVPNSTWGYGKLDIYAVLAPSLVLTAPNGGEAWGLGTSQSILWNASATGGISGVDIDYSLNSGLTWTNIVTGAPNTGSYLWTVAGGPCTTAMVRVNAHDNCLNYRVVKSASVFTIALPTSVRLAGLVAEPENGHVDLSWSAAIDGPAIFQVLRSTSLAGEYSKISEDIASNPANAYSYRDLSAKPATEYFYKIGYNQNGGGGFSSPLRVVTPAASFAIRSITPNPTTGSARIDYEIARSGRVSLEVYDLSGRRIRTLVNGVADAGAGSVAWDGRGTDGRVLTGGVYFARLVSNGQVLTQKITLVR